MFLYGDIGGTKTQFALAPDANQPLSEFFVAQNSQHHSFLDLLNSYLARVNQYSISHAYLSVAGPVEKNHCQLTNLNWYLSADEICAHTGITQVHLMNDLSATAFAVPRLRAQDFTILQNGPPVLQNGPIAILSVGTGLGESVLIWEAELNRYESIAGEGGHRHFAPHTRLELQLLNYVNETSGLENFETEHLISGNGIVLIYNFLCWQSPNTVPAEEKNLFTPQAIVTAAYRNPEGICCRVLNLLSGLIATESANVALQYYSRGGVIIAGGIPEKISQFLCNETFTQRFQERAKFSTWLQSIPVAICRNYQAPLMGAQYRSSFPL